MSEILISGSSPSATEKRNTGTFLPGLSQGLRVLIVIDDVRAQIQADTGIELEFALEAFSDLEEDVREARVHFQASPFIPHKEAVRDSNCEIEPGRLQEVT